VPKRQAAPHRKRPPPHKLGLAEVKKHQDELLDEALEETFPASDPIAVDPVETPAPAGSSRRARGRGSSSQS